MADLSVVSNDSNDSAEMPDCVVEHVNGDSGEMNPSPHFVDEEDFIQSHILDLEVPVTGYEILESRAQFTVFKLLIKVSGVPRYQILRRYTDFCRLQDSLLQSSRGLRLTLPPKRWFGGNFDKRFLEDRQLGLQAFLHSVCAHPDLNRSPALRRFLCLDGRARPGDDPVAEVMQHGQHQQHQQQLRQLEPALSQKYEKKLTEIKEELKKECTRRVAAESECDRLKKQVDSLMQALRLERNYFREKMSTGCGAAVECNSSSTVQLTPPGAVSSGVDANNDESGSVASPAPTRTGCSEDGLRGTVCSLSNLE